MKFPRNARIFRGQFDAAPFASVLFLLVIFVQLGSLVYTPGVHIQLPVADGFVGTEKMPVRVAMDANGRLYFDNHLIDENELRIRLHNKVAEATEPLSLVVMADKAITHEMFTRLTVIAQQAGFSEAVLATLPPPVGDFDFQTFPMNTDSLQQTAWRPRRWLGAVLFVFILQLVFIFWLGERPRIISRPKASGFTWRIAGPAWAEILSLQDPTLFLLPHWNGFSGPAWMVTPGLPASSFFWTEAPRLLTLSERDLGQTFNRFASTNHFGPLRTLALSEPTITLPEVPKRVVLPASSSFRIEGPLSRRSLLTKPQLRGWAHSELLTNSVIQLIVDEDGRPVTPGTVLFPSGLAAADQYALDQVRTIRFKPLADNDKTTSKDRLTRGLLIFEWTTLPLPLTNAPIPAATPPP